MNRRRLERELSRLSSFADPDPAREQYPTPADLAAHLVHVADLQGDLERPVVDLGAGTGVLAIGAALKGARAVGVELDGGALAIAVENADAAGVEVDWIRADVTAVPICFRASDRVTVLSNPPFGAQDDSAGDRPFLETIAELAAVSYTVHNAGSRAFVESFVADAGGTVTHAFAGELRVDRQFEFHAADHRDLDVELYRIEWD